MNLIGYSLGRYLKAYPAFVLEHPLHPTTTISSPSCPPSSLEAVSPAFRQHTLFSSAAAACCCSTSKGAPYAINSLGIITDVSYRFMGGNSTKATSGINGAGTQPQQELGIPDNAKIFFEDTKKSVSQIPFLSHMSWPPRCSRTKQKRRGGYVEYTSTHRCQQMSPDDHAHLPLPLSRCTSHWASEMVIILCALYVVFLSLLAMHRTIIRPPSLHLVTTGELTLFGIRVTTCARVSRPFPFFCSVSSLFTSER